MQIDAGALPRILIVDDSRIVRVSAQKMLCDQFDVAVAESGETAWARINSDPGILAVFTDLSMPGLDGDEVLRRIRADERELISGLPVIIVTGHDDEAARERALAAGAKDFIIKPFDRAQLVARAHAHATHDRMRRKATALEKSQTQDTVTGLGNFRYFKSRLSAARAYALRHERPMALIRIDVAGIEEATAGMTRARAEQLLQQAGHVLAHQVREEDVLAHLAPGRFAAICPNCTAEGAQRLAQRLIEAVGDAADADGEYVLAATAGVHVPANDSRVDLQTVYDATRTAADEARARGQGGLVVAAGEHGTTSATETEPTLDEALAMLATAEGTERLRAHMPALLERCARLFEAAPRDVAAPVVERLRRRIGRQAETSAGHRSGRD